LDVHLYALLLTYERWTLRIRPVRMFGILLGLLYFKHSSRDCFPFCVYVGKHLPLLAYLRPSVTDVNGIGGKTTGLQTLLTLATTLMQSRALNSILVKCQE